ncbi:EAL domain-containing protein [Xanthobacter sediminis]
MQAGVHGAVRTPIGLATTSMKQRIFILDDDEAFREDCTEMLVFAGHEVDGAGDAAGLGDGRLDGVDLLMLDLELRSVDGADVMRQVLRLDAPPDIVLVSGHGEDVLGAVADAGRLEGAKIRGALKKPFDPDRLLRLLARRPAGAAARVMPGVPAADMLAARDPPVHFLPKVDARSLAFDGADVLLAGTRPGSGPLPPIVAMEAGRRGHLARLTAQVFRAGLAGCRYWRRAGHVGWVSIDLPLDAVLQPGGCQTCVSFAREAALLPGATICGLAEHLPCVLSGEALVALAQKRVAGFGLTLDDAGERPGAALQFARLPVTELKLDRRLLKLAQKTTGARCIFAALVDMGHQRGLKVVAEGVETVADLDFVRAHDVDLVQGYLVSRKMPIEELVIWLNARTATQDATLRAAGRW